MKKLRTALFHILFLFACTTQGFAPSAANAQDTARHSVQQRRHLQPVSVVQDKKPSSTLSQTPVQVVDIVKMERSGALLLSDAVKQMAGVTIRDYGGIGGVKTVSARGLGSQLSTLTIDGVAVNDCQNGQVDLGRYMLGNSAFVSLSNGLQDEMLLSARAVAAGSVINMETLEPQFLPGQNTHIRLATEGGSFGLLSPSLTIEQRLGRKLKMSLWANWLRSDGDYPFTLYYTTSHNDSSSVERRDHSAMWMATGDLNLFYTIAPNQSLTGKVHYVQSFHELPGPVVFYSSRGHEDTREKLFFSQVRYTARHSKLNLQIIGKYQYTDDLYEDFRAMTVSRYLMNRYSQHEGYLSGSMVWRPLRGLSAGLASDAALTTLHSNLAVNSSVQRLSSLTTASLQYKHGRLDIKGNLLATIINEDACDNPSTVTYRKLSPYLGVTIRPLASSPLRLRYFIKETYRVPTFNEMYYFVMPLDTLHPECALQQNIGVTLPLATRYSSDSLFRRLYSITVDAYRNNVTDKIIAVPRQNMFLWSTMNLGRVDINGIDVNGTMDMVWQRMSLNLTLTYSLQHAVDHTDPNNPKTYGHQIPYTPRHSGGATLYFQNPWLNFGYSCMAVGERYYQQQNSDDTRLPDYADHTASIDRTFELPIGDLRIQAQVLNIFNVQYEVVRSYPMMGRNFRIKISYEF